MGKFEIVTLFYKGFSKYEMVNLFYAASCKYNLVPYNLVKGPKRLNNVIRILETQFKYDWNLHNFVI